MPVPSDLTESPIAESRPVSARLTNNGALRLKSNHPWFYVFYPDHPGNWFVGSIEPGPDVPDADVGAWWLPQLQTEAVQPGVNGHRTLRRGAPPESAYSNAHELIRRDGGTVLPHSLGYIREVPCVDPMTQTPGVRHIDVWSNPRRTVQRGQRQKFEFDRQRYYRWLLALMRDGTIPLPDPHIIEPRQAQVVARVERLETNIYATPEVRSSVIDAAKSEAARVVGAKVVDPEEEKPRRTRKPIDAR